MELFEEKLARTAIRLSWSVLGFVMVMVFSGIVLCFWGAKDAGSNFSLLGLKLSSGDVGLFVIAMGIVMFSMQKRFFEILLDPKKLLSVGSHISKAKQRLYESEKNMLVATSPGTLVNTGEEQDRIPVKRWHARHTEPGSKTVAIRLIFILGVSLLILTVSVVVLTNPESSANTAKLACAFLGAVVGYWMR